MVVPDPDTIPPAVVWRTPTDGDDQVSVRSPIRAVFSEAVKLGATPVTLLVNGAPIPTGFSLSSDAKVLTVSPRTEIVAPARVSLSFTDVTDSRGNPLVRPSWSWTVPRWIKIGDTLRQPGTIFFPRIAAGPGERVSVALSLPETTTVGGRPVSVQAVETPTSKWGSRGEPTGKADELSFLVDKDGVPVVAYKDASDNNVYVERLEGQTWRLIGGPFPSELGGGVALAVDKQGVLFLAYDESTTDGARNVVVKILRTLDPVYWSSLAPTVNDPSTETGTDLQSLVLDENGIPYVAYRTASSKAYVRVWSDTKWTAVGALLNSPAQAVKTLAIGLDGSSNLFAMATWYDRYLSTRHVQILRFDHGNWVLCGTDIANEGTVDPSFLARMRNGHLFAYASTEAQSYLLDVTTDGWTAIQPPADRPSSSFGAAALDPEGVPIIGWTENDTMTVMRLNRQGS